MIEKIKRLISNTQAKRLNHHIFIDGNIKTKVEAVKRFIDTIHSAIEERRKLTFTYQKYDVNKKLVAHREGKIYTVCPLGLVWNSDFYYLVANEDGKDEVKHFRVDRMVGVETKDEVYKKYHFNIAEYVGMTFNMYAGPVQPVEIQFDNHLVNVVIDKFGPGVNLHKIDDKSFKIRVHAANSDGLVRWILTWGSDAKVLSPKSLVERMTFESQKMKSLYE